MPFVKLTAEGQIPLPLEIREKLGLNPGDLLSVEPTDTGLSVVAATEPSHLPAKPVLQESIARKNLETPMQFIKGVGPKLAETLLKKGIATVEDALWLLPNRYEDRRALSRIAQLRPGKPEVFSGEVLAADTVQTRGGKRFF